MSEVDLPTNMPSIDNVTPIRKKRKAISDKLRFEVFKRDSFKCKYCGANGESIILHVDHITPVAEGGGNDIMNLITSCSQCNLGKGARTLDDSAVAAKSRKQAEEIQVMAEQLEMMSKWRTELLNHSNNKTTRLVEYWDSLTPGYSLKESAYPDIKKLTNKYEFDQIASAMDKAVAQYLKYKSDGNCTSESYNIAFGKIGGILKWEEEFKKNPELEQLFRIRAIAAKSCPNYFPTGEATKIIKEALAEGVDPDDLKMAAGQCSSWTNFANRVDDLMAEKNPPPPPEPTDPVVPYGVFANNLIFCDTCEASQPTSKTLINVTWYPPKKEDEDPCEGDIFIECNGAGCRPTAIAKQEWEESDADDVESYKVTRFPTSYWYNHNGFVGAMAFFGASHFNFSTWTITKVMQRLYIPNYDQADRAARDPELKEKDYRQGRGYYQKSEIQELLAHSKIKVATAPNTQKGQP